jgi:hypothetical protein
MNDTAFFEAFDHNGVWFGTATLEAILAANLIPDRDCIYWGDKSLGGADGWACKAKPQ